ncbi:MAG: hypothetical protein CSA32_02975 [Desulfobulbus propionicus]|nr:MAG: hypothetical protein CSA32_02975 [Desulfobulbus propionicus]
MFAEKNIAITETVNAGKEKITGEDAWELLKQADEIIVGRGRKYVVFEPGATNKEEVLKQTLGRTGNLRAPTLRIGKKLIIGYSDEMYAQHIQ